MTEKYCKVCSGSLVYLGKLGNLRWYRCEDCGLEWSIEISDDDDDE